MEEEMRNSRYSAYLWRRIRENLLKWSGDPEKLTEALISVPERLTLFRKSEFAEHTARWIFQTEVDKRKITFIQKG